VSHLHVSSIHLISSRAKRHVDSAQLYQNEEGVGQAVREVLETGRLRREDLFISEFLVFRDTENDEA
jgi:diketogulonate reductase-like aldo/keto reductase